VSSGNRFDLDGDIDDDDITEWISLTDKVNGYGSTFLRGDTDGLGNLPGTPQTFDITDFKNFLNGFTGDGST